MAVWDVTGGKVMFKKYSQIGTHCVVFPNITIDEGSVVGANSLVNCNWEPWSINFGVPAIKKKIRRKYLVSLI